MVCNNRALAVWARDKDTLALANGPAHAWPGAAIISPALPLALVTFPPLPPTSHSITCASSLKTRPSPTLSPITSHQDCLS